MAEEDGQKIDNIPENYEKNIPEKQINCFSKIYRVINDKSHSDKSKASLEPALTWRDIADFRIYFWIEFKRFLKNNCFNFSKDEQNSVTDNYQKNMWLKLMPEVAVFSFAQTSEESVVSLFLELLLAEVNWDVLFKNSQTEDLIFQDSQENRLEFTYVLILFFSLLSRSQRRQVGIGSRGAPFTDTGINFLERFSDRADEGSATNIYRAWPKQISLFARHWITTVPDLMPRYDIRKAIDIHPLPKGSVIFEKSYWSKLKCRNKEPLDKQILENYGPTVAGTWYLGILKGGNTDLGTDVMKVILSEEYEKQRLFNRCGAPVSAALYNKDFIGPKAERDNNNGTVKICKKPNTSNHELPYADVMQAVYCDLSVKSNTKQEKSNTSTNPKNEEQKTIHSHPISRKI